MNIGYFITPEKQAVLVVLDYTNWIETIKANGFPKQPVITRSATTPEVVALEEHDGFPGWLYHNVDELIDDEIKSGAAHHHLSALIEATARMPKPQLVTSNTDAA